MVTFMTVFAIQADTYGHDAAMLPVAAQTTLKANFKAGVSLVKVDKDFGRVSEYEVILTDGTEVTFDRAGNVKEVETAAANAVPSALVPQNIRSYVKNTHSGTRIVGYEVKRSGYEVTLSNGLELKFNKQGNFVKYDD